MSIGVVQEKGHSQKGARKLKINGQWHFVGRTNCDGIERGMTVEYTAAPFGDGNKLSGLNNIRPVSQQVIDSAKLEYNYKQAALGRPQIGSTITDGDVLRSVSNVVGSACAAGTITSHEEVHVWIVAAYTAFTQMGKDVRPAQIPGGSGVSQGSAPREDEEPPPYDDSEVPWR